MKLLLLILVSNVSLALPTLSEMMAEEEKSRQQSPIHLCLEKNDYNACESVMLRLNKPIYFEKMREIISKSNNIEVIERYIKLTKKTWAAEIGDKRDTNKAISRLQTAHRFHGNKNQDAMQFKKSYLLKGNLEDMKSFSKYANTKTIENNNNFIKPSDKAVFEKIILKKLRKIANKDSYYVAFKLGRNRIDLDEALKRLNEKGYKKNTAIISDYYDISVKSFDDALVFINQLNRCTTCNKEDYFEKMVLLLHDLNEIPKYMTMLTSCTSCNKTRFFNKMLFLIRETNDIPRYLTHLRKCNSCNVNSIKKNIASLGFFGRSVYMSNFFNSIEYKYILKDIGYSISHSHNNRKYSISVNPSKGRKLTFSFTAKCRYSRKTSQIEKVGFFKSMFAGADEKEVYYNVDQCRPLQDSDKEKIYTFYKKSNKLASYESMKGASWDYYTKTSERYIPRPVYTYSQNTYDTQQSSSSNNSSSSSRRSSNSSSRKNRRGVKNIVSNGRVSGVPSQRIECTGGSDYIVYHKNGKWYKSASHMGNKYNSWSVNQVGDYLCK